MGPGLIAQHCVSLFVKYGYSLVVMYPTIGMVPQLFYET